MSELESYPLTIEKALPKLGISDIFSDVNDGDQEFSGSSGHISPILTRIDSSHSRVSESALRRAVGFYVAGNMDKSRHERNEEEQN